ncbi:MAG: c-di-GMP-binding flagellar brake protein YcgR [Gammaproteobacteria bacterium]|jgi:c-di-GMP-binding flagellar brake protein YcgR
MPDERRRYFRIEDTVSFALKPVKNSELQPRLDDFWSDTKEYALRHQFNHQLEQHLADFKVIEKNMPELARYLTVLQKKIDTINDRMLPEQTAISAQTHRVSLSAQGMAYTTTAKLIVGETVELDLKLLSTGQIIKIYALVVDVETVSNEFRISLDFTHIYGSDQDILVKRIHVLQLKAIAVARSTDS